MMELIVEHILWTSRDQKVFDFLVTVWFMFELANTQLFTHTPDTLWYTVMCTWAHQYTYTVRSQDHIYYILMI